MKCDLCNNEASVHEVTVRNGVKFERNLCESCAAQHGLESQGGGPIAEIIKQFMAPGGSAVAVPVVPGGQRVAVCPSCRMTFNEFKQGGLLGCPECYRAFEAQLGPLLERAHEGAIAHAGKSPRRQGAPVARPTGLSLAERAMRLEALHKQLEQAVRSEQYEIAAKVRDEIKRMGDAPGAQP
ncbi:MAG: UvrB/UvrC motif-containing protein [Planctomycetes bacterium]|nr:UvrB/UvrC motif-containing protein [Planctomycetota bacterium]